MANSNTREMAIEAIVVLNAAFTNIRLYPPTSDMIGNSVDRAYSIFQDIFEHDDPVIFAESEGNLIISGQVLGEADKKKPQITAFIKLMISLAIKSISFEKGLKKEEILSFLTVVSEKPEDLEEEGGISGLMASKGIRNIHIDKKLFIAMDKDQRIVSAEEAGAEPFEVSSAAAKEENDTDRLDNNRNGESRQVDGDPGSLTGSDSEKRDKEQRKQQVLHIQNGINSLLKGDSSVFQDPLIMKALPPTILRMYSQEKEEKALAIINRLCRGLLSKEDKIRAQVSLVLAHIIIKFVADNRIEEMARIIPGITKWIEFETVVSPAYKHICVQLKSAAVDLISNHRLIEGNQILRPFHLIYSGGIEMPEAIKKIAGEVLKGIASTDVFNLLIDVFLENEDEVKEQGLKTFAFLDPWSTKFLLDALKKLPESESPANLKGKILIQEYICRALGLTGSGDAVPALNLIIERKDPLNTDIFNKGVQDAARSAIEMIEQGPPPKPLKKKNIDS